MTKYDPTLRCPYLKNYNDYYSPDWVYDSADPSYRPSAKPAAR